MNIVYESEQMTFAEIKAGTVFSTANFIFIKTDKDDAVELEEGKVFRFDPDDPVEVLKATLHIED